MLPHETLLITTMSCQMRLLDTHTLEFHWIYSPKDELYVILSHVWNREGEQTLQVSTSDSVCASSYFTREIWIGHPKGFRG